MTGKAPLSQLMVLHARSEVFTTSLVDPIKDTSQDVLMRIEQRQSKHDSLKQATKKKKGLILTV